MLHCTEFTLPRPYLSGRRHPRVAKPAWVFSPVMEEEMKLREEAAERERNLEKDEQRHEGNSLKKVWVPESRSRTDQQSSASEQQATNPTRPATEDPAPHLLNDGDPRLFSNKSRDKCETVNEQSTRNGSGDSSVDDEDEDDSTTLPGVRSCATDSSADDLEDDNNGREEGERSGDDSVSPGADKDFPPLATIRDGVLPHPTEPAASRKMHGQWEIPLSFHPHNNPTGTLASRPTAPVQAPVQGKAETPQANSKTVAAALTQQESYDLLADFPALQPPRRPLALGVLHNGNPNTTDARGKRGLIHRPNHRHETGATHQRKMENVPREVSSICAGDQKSVLDLQTLTGGQWNSPIISCEELKANNQPPPRVAGADGAGVNARSWACAAKAGMKQAAAPQEKARPCSFQQIVTINRAKAAPQNYTYKVAPPLIIHYAYREANPLVTGLCCGPQPCNPNQFVRPGYPPTHQHFGAQVHPANCPPRFAYPRFHLQQAGGNFPKHKHV
ncbi:uncharacterized protein LOC113154857 isoform X2 [Anabas testudineus]|nr:uncharacterized protein LOC113154857 isoform X2 [Anabas testudineus]